MPAIARILETALYVDDLDGVAAFYQNLFGFPVLLEASERLIAFDAGQATVLLLFKRGSTLTGVNLPGGWVPPHDGHGPVHIAFAIAPDAVDAWEAHLQAHGIAVESRIRWGGGGRSVYFRDPAGHSVELATPGTWTVY